jgi:hypothetical protein
MAKPSAWGWANLGLINTTECLARDGRHYLTICRACSWILAANFIGVKETTIEMLHFCMCMVSNLWRFDSNANMSFSTRSVEAPASAGVPSDICHRELLMGRSSTSLIYTYPMNSSTEKETKLEGTRR